MDKTTFSKIPKSPTVNCAKVRGRSLQNKTQSNKAVLATEKGTGANLAAR